MKKITMIMVTFMFLGLATLNAQETKSQVMKSFLSGIITFEKGDLDPNTPIASVNTVAEKKAAKFIKITKENIADALKTAKEFKHCVITVADHTIVKVTDLADCSPSGSWGACMPMGKGLVQKGSFTEKSDYIKNIIGRADSQVRTMFLFN